MQSFIQPLVRPYERTIDALFAVCLSLFFNLVFLSSLPIAHALLWLRKGPLQLVKAIGWRRPWDEPNRGGIAKRERTAGSAQTASAAQRVPPPASRKLGAPHSPVARNRRDDDSSGSDGDQAVQSVKPQRLPGPARRPTAEIGPSQTKGRATSAKVPQPSLPKARLVSGPAAAQSGAAVRSHLGPSTTLPRSKTTNFSLPAGHQAESPTLAKTVQALNSLPAVPQGFSQGVDGGFAFIPPATPPVRQQVASPRPKLESAITAAHLFSPIFPGSFAPAPDSFTPLRMPEDAKASRKAAVSSTTTPKRKVKSSTATRLSAKPVGNKPAESKMEADRRKRQVSAPPKEHEEGAREGLFLQTSDASSEEENDAPYIIEPPEHSPPAKRKVLRPSTSMVLPSSRSKRQKLDVLADAEETDGGTQKTEIARRTRGTSAGPSSGIRSRATSVAPSESESVAISEADQDTNKHPLRSSVSSRTLRKPPSRVVVTRPSEEERPAKAASKPPVSGLRKAGKAANGAKSGSTTRPRVKSGGS